MGISMRQPGTILALTGGLAASTPDGSLVVASAVANYTALLPAGASPTTPVLGLLYKTSGAANTPVEVVVSGVYPGVAGATIAAKDLLTSNGTDGTVKPVAASAGTNEAVIGMALEAAESGERVAILITPFIRQG